ncbi:hypothetical protein JCM10213_000038 [Rhodosporidiobolus nylandii]
MSALSATPSFASTSTFAPAPPPPAPSTSAGAATNLVLPGNGDLWSSILDSVKGSRSVQTKQCLILGAPNSGKSTLLARLRTSNGELPPPSAAANGNGQQGSGGGKLDLGLGYEVLDVRDEGDEGDTLARLGLFQLPSPSPPYPSLLSLALSKQTLLDSLVVIVLDWERPWRFVEELEGWIGLLEARLAQGDKDGLGGGWEGQEGRERVEAFLRAYHEPPLPSSSAPSTSTAAAALDPDAPLPPGTLTSNLGVGLVIVCTKADHMNILEREREFTEEQFDYIQQTLRTVALRYGAALFYTSQTLPSSFSKLRQYLLHRLFSSPSSAPAPPTSPTSSSAPPTRAAPAPTTASASFAFPHRANVIDRDAVLVPAGWDSRGKIRVLRERFDAEQVGEGWEVDLAAMRGAEAEQGKGLRREYEALVVDFEGVDQPSTSAPPTSALDEQSFLSTHYETLQADAVKDPRLAFRQPAAAGAGAGGLAPSVVGPMAGTTLELPTVVSTLERARERGEDGRRAEAGTRGMTRQGSQTSASARSPPLTSSSTMPSSLDAPTSRHSPSLSASLLSRQPSSGGGGGGGGAAPAPAAAAGTAGSAAGGNQVLADFFQSLLTARTAGGGGASGLGASTRKREGEEGGK